MFQLAFCTFVLKFLAIPNNVEKLFCYLPFRISGQVGASRIVGALEPVQFEGRRCGAEPGDEFFIILEVKTGQPGGGRGAGPQPHLF